MKKFHEAVNTLDRERRGRKWSARSSRLLKNKKHEKKAVMKSSPKLQNLGHRSRCEHIYHALGVEGQSRGDALQDAASPEDEKIFDIQQVVNQQNDRIWAFSLSTEEKIVTRRQNPQYVMVLAALTETERSPLLFVPSRVKLNSQRYIANILEDCLLPWTKKHFQGTLWSLQQDSAPSHASKITQFWIQTNPPSFISKEVWPARSSDLKPVDFSIWSILETKACFFPYLTVEALKAKLVKEWAAIPQENNSCRMCLVLSQIEDRS